MPILSLAGVSLNEDEGEQRTDGIGTGLELNWGLVCEQGHSQVVSVIKAQFVIRGQTIALSGVWTLIFEIRAHRRLCSMSQAVVETET